MLGFGEGTGEGTGQGTGGAAGALQWATGRQPIAEPLLEDGEFQSIKTEFCDEWWDPQLRAQLVLADFLQLTKWRTCTKLPEPPNSNEVLKVEIEGLLSKASRRSTRQDEIVAQSDTFVDYWYRLLMADQHRRPATVTLIQIGIAVGGTMALYWKNKYKRMRPCQAFPGLMPMISTPPHPSYPSGHSTQAHLIWLCVRDAVPSLDEPLRKLAARIAQNREIAGVHFSSDTAAGVKLACRDSLIATETERKRVAQLRGGFRNSQEYNKRQVYKLRRHHRGSKN